MKDKKKKKKIGKVNPLLYALLYVIFTIQYNRKFRITYDKKIVKSIKGPALVLATHTSDKDHILSALSLYPIRPTYVVGDHFLRNPATAKLITMMHVIPKKMFCADISTVKNIMRAKNENAVIVIFGEGRLSCYGHSLPLAKGTAELIKKLGVNVYSWKGAGSYLSFPKWRDKGDDRPGRIHCTVKQVLTAEQIAEMSIAEIEEVAKATILHDDELAMEGIEYKSDTMARGADRILFKCPKCLKEDCITTQGNHIRCECGLDATLDSKYKLHGAPFSRMNEWFDWQQASIDTEGGHLQTKARIGYCGEDGLMDPHAGHGEVYMDKDVFTLSATVHGEKLEFTVKTEQIGAFPISPGDHIDIYHNGNLIHIFPEPDQRTVVKWVCFLDALNAKREQENNKDS